MATEVQLVRAHREHAEKLACAMRPLDMLECASAGRTPLEALLDGMTHSEACWAALFNGEVAAMGGAVPQGGTILTGVEYATVWALTGPDIARHPKAYLKASRAAVAYLLARYGALVAYVDARYEAAVRWVQRLGFIVGDARQLPGFDAPTHAAWLRR